MKCDSATIWYRDTFRGARHQAAIDVLEKRKGDHPTHVFTYEGNPIVQVSTKAWHREAGTPTHELQRLGGWKTQSMVERYAHVAPEGLQFAASRLDSFMHGCGCTQTTILVESEAKRPI